MRRSGSSSCMLRPKSSLSSDDLQKMAEEPPLTVTMINTTRLATYSTERYYMLSELEHNASSLEFVCDLPSTLSDNHVSSQLQEAKKTDSPSRESAVSRSRSQPRLPPHVMLYLLWRPNTYPSPRAFVEGPVMDNVKRILELGGDDVATLFEAAALASSPGPSPSSSPLSPQFGDGITNGGGNGAVGQRTSFGGHVSLRADSARAVMVDTRTKIYLCVERLSPPPSSRDATAGDALLPNIEISEMDDENETDDNVRASAEEASVDDEARRLRQHAVETQIAEAVAKTVSTHPILRGIVEGVSVGTTAEVRAAPGLEVCLKAVTHGTGERRRQARVLQRRKLRLSADEDNVYQKDPMRSPVCLVAPHPDDLVGLDPEAEADAAQGVIQSITVAEWNGNGDGVCFASRGMESWRKANGLESEVSNTALAAGSIKSSRKKSRASRSSSYNDDAEDIAQTMVVAFMIAVAAFLWTKYRESIWAALFEMLQRIYER